MSKKYEYRLFLCKPTKEEIDEISFDNLIYNDYFESANFYNELDFTIPYYEEGWEIKKDVRFDLTKGVYFIHMLRYFDGELDKSEYFVIDDPNISYGTSIDKKIHCYSSYYATFSQRVLRSYEQIGLLYDADNPTDRDAGLINYMLFTIFNSWTIRTTADEYKNIVRTWDFSSNNYPDVIQSVQNEIGCIFVFDTNTNEIDILNPTTIGEDSDIVISDQNHLKSLSNDDRTKEIKTRIRVYGKDNITFSSQNPTGQFYIDDFSYFLNNGYFSSGLERSLIAYNSLLLTKTGEFETYLTTLNSLNEDLIIKQNQLIALETDLEIIEDDLDIMKNTSYSNDALYDARFIDKTNKEAEIEAKELEIVTLNGQIAFVRNDINLLSDEVLYENNFTSDELKELSNYIYEDVLSLNNIDDESLLYEYALEYLAIKSQPIIELDLNEVVNIFEVEGNEKKKIKSGNYVYIDCTELGYNYTQLRIVNVKNDVNGNEMSLIVSNNDKINHKLNTLSQNILKKSLDAANNIDANKYDYKQYVTEKSQILFDDELIDAGNNPIQAGQIRINKRGFLGSDIGSNGGVLQYLNDKVVISQDNMETFHTLLSGNGLYLERNDKKARIVISPSYGIQTDRNMTPEDPTPTWNNTLYIDTNGELRLNTYDQSINALDGRVTTNEASIIANANEISLKVSETDYNGNTIASLINQTATTIDIEAEKINLTGYVTLTNLTDETTVISGGNIKTGTIDTNLIRLESDDNALLIEGNQIQMTHTDGSVSTLTPTGLKVEHVSGEYSLFNAQGFFRYVDATPLEYISAISAGTVVSSTSGWSGGLTTTTKFTIQLRGKQWDGYATDVEIQISKNQFRPWLASDSNWQVGYITQSEFKILSKTNVTNGVDIIVEASDLIDVSGNIGDRDWVKVDFSYLCVLNRGAN